MTTTTTYKSQAILDREAADAARCPFCREIAALGSHGRWYTPEGKKDCPNVGLPRSEWTRPTSN